MLSQLHLISAMLLDALQGSKVAYRREIRGTHATPQGKVANSLYMSRPSARDVGLNAVPPPWSFFM
jgi:hypothetical protein